MSETYTGGCQCGAVRFRIEGTLGEASICHCRMCQKAFGNFFAPLVDARHEDLAWTRGKPSYYASSDVVDRGFCSRCGTPLVFAYRDYPLIGLAIGAFRLYLYDTTLRDGGQTPGIDFSLEDKLSIIRLLDELGIDYIEGGYPGANETDTALFAEPRNEGVVRSLRHDRRAGRSPANDPGLQDLVQAESQTRCALLPRPGTTMCAWR
jgi:hypothetical protein